MKLLQFQVQNFRSINDSGEILVADRTALVGRNESGKSNLLTALEHLNPAGGVKKLNPVKDFPRDRSLDECTDDTDVVRSLWELTPADQAAIKEVYPRGAAVKQVRVIRPYGATRRIGFIGLPSLAVDFEQVKQQIKSIQSSVGAATKNLEGTQKTSATQAVEKLSTSAKDENYDPEDWATDTATHVQAFRDAMAAASVAIPGAAETGLTELIRISQNILNDEAQQVEARKVVIKRLPLFIYLSDYPDLDGHQRIASYLQRVQEGQDTEADKNFKKLCKVAGLNPEELNSLSANDHEKRQQLANRAGALITGKIRALWTDRQLKVRFNLDGEHLDTLISDPTAVYDVEVNLNERSRGFKWFFSFYITFAADTDGGPADSAILLLDEPGLYLHAIAQGDLLAHFKKDFKNQILFTTHSPFMIPVSELDSVRTVNISQDSGTTVSNDPIGDEKTLFPLQTALGYDTSQSLFIGEKNLVVEGVSDYWYLNAASDYLNDQSSEGLVADAVITPAGGAQRITYMVSLLASHRLRVVVLLDSEPKARLTSEDIKKAKLLREDDVVFISHALKGVTEADIEDLIEPSVFDALVQESYKKELAGLTLNINSRIPRIAKRYEDAFTAAGLTFNKTRPAKLFLQLLGTNPAQVMTPVTEANFKAILKEVNAAIDRQVKRGPEPFK